jgi:hypothetical protein
LKESHDAPFLRQFLPNYVTLHGESIKQLARGIKEHFPTLASTLRQTRVDVFPLGLVHGEKKPVLGRRAQFLTDAIKPHQPKGVPQTHLLQVLMHTPDTIHASFSPVLDHCWPVCTPGAIFPVADEPLAPGGTFRKLVEAFHWMGVFPEAGQYAVDLGAAPGAYTHIFAQSGVRVDAVDRSRLSDTLMKHPLVSFHATDAFSYVPSRTPDWVAMDLACAPDLSVDLMLRYAREYGARLIVGHLKLRNGLASSSAGADSAGADSGIGVGRRERYWQRQQDIKAGLPIPRKTDVENEFALLDAHIPPITRVLHELRGSGYRVTVKHLWHDRHEVSVMATKLE